MNYRSIHSSPAPSDRIESTRTLEFATFARNMSSMKDQVKLKAVLEGKSGGVEDVSNQSLNLTFTFHVISLHIRVSVGGLQDNFSVFYLPRKATS